MLRLAHLVNAFCLAAAGCAMPASSTADATAVQPTGRGMMEQRLPVTLCMTNPNADPLSFRQVTINLDLAGSPFAVGSINVPIRLEPRSSTRLPLTVVTTMTNLPWQFVELPRAPEIDYRLIGSVALEGSLGIRVPYRRSGRLDPMITPDLAASSSSDPDATLPQCARSDIAVPL